MHTYKGKSLIIHHDGDYKGECYIVDKETKTQIKVSCEDLLDFAAEYVRSKRISEIENMSTDEILN